MSIFNEIGLAIGKGTEGIGAKAKVIRESSKLSFMVGEEEKSLRIIIRELVRFMQIFIRMIMNQNLRN